MRALKRPLNMNENYSPALKPGADEEAIEPEIVSGPSLGTNCGYKTESVMGRFRAFIFKLKLLFTAVIGLIALTLIVIGAVLTSTFIGAVLGIPLMLAGGLLIWLLLKALKIFLFLNGFKAAR